jgi:integrase
MGRPMTSLRLQYVHEYRDRHGKVRRYFRRPRCKKTTLPGQPGSAEFMAAYQAALAGAQKIPVAEKRTAPGTIAAGLVGFYASGAFTSLAPETKRTMRNVLERFKTKHGTKRVATLEARHLEEMVGAMGDRPAAARNFLRSLRAFMRYCVSVRLRDTNPAVGIKGFKMNKEGYKPWDDEQIALYRRRHKLGTKARVALELLLNVGSRRSDAIRLGHQHVKAGEFKFRTQKTGALVEGVPLLPELAEAIDAMPKRTMTFLETDYGKPYAPAGFGNWFRDRCKEAGLPAGYSAHGLRKASAIRLAEQGATAHQLMAWFGWTTMREAERYTKAANNRKLARAAGALIKTGTVSG